MLLLFNRQWPRVLFRRQRYIWKPRLKWMTDQYRCLTVLLGRRGVRTNNPSPRWLRENTYQGVINLLRVIDPRLGRHLSPINPRSGFAAQPLRFACYSGRDEAIKSTGEAVTREQICILYWYGNQDSLIENTYWVRRYGRQLDILNNAVKAGCSAVRYILSSDLSTLL